MVLFPIIEIQEKIPKTFLKLKLYWMYNEEVIVWQNTLLALYLYLDNIPNFRRRFLQ